MTELAYSIGVFWCLAMFVSNMLIADPKHAIVSAVINVPPIFLLLVSVTHRYFITRRQKRDDYNPNVYTRLKNEATPPTHTDAN